MVLCLADLVPAGFRRGYFDAFANLLSKICKIVLLFHFSNKITVIANTIIDFLALLGYNYFIYDIARFEWRSRHEG